MAANKRAFHSVVQLFIWFRELVHSVFRSFVGELSVDRLSVNSVIRAFVCVSGLSSYSSVCPVFLVIHAINNQFKAVLKHKEELSSCFTSNTYLWLSCFSKRLLSTLICPQKIHVFDQVVSIGHDCAELRFQFGRRPFFLVKQT